MRFELDHLFIFTSMGAPEGSRMIEFGLSEGSKNVHPGQGTANRRFFFRNAFLELLWVRDEQEVSSDEIRPTHLWERWRHQETGYSPFGLCFRPSGTEGLRRSEPPFRAWEYRPPYLPDTLRILIAEDSGYPGEPMLFYLPFGRRPDVHTADQPLEHVIGFEEVTAIRLTIPGTGPISGALQAVQNSASISTVSGATHLCEVFFDHAGQGKTHDFRPQLPLIFRW